MLLQFPLAMVSNCIVVSAIVDTLSQFSQVTSNIIEALVSVKRLSGFLRAEELQQDAQVKVQKNSLAIGDVVCRYPTHLDAI